MFIYCGGVAKWQRLEDVVRLFTAMYQRSQRCRFLFLVREPELIRGLTEGSGIPKHAIAAFSAKPSEVPSWLAVGDYGVVLRHNEPANNVACPIKIGEYLMAGLRVVASPYIGDLSDIILELDLGQIVSDEMLVGDPMPKIVEAEPVSVQEKQRIRSIAVERFGGDA